MRNIQRAVRGKIAAAARPCAGPPQAPNRNSRAKSGRCLSWRSRPLIAPFPPGVAAMPTSILLVQPAAMYSLRSPCKILLNDWPLSLAIHPVSIQGIFPSIFPPANFIVTGHHWWNHQRLSIARMPSSMHFVPLCCPPPSRVASEYHECTSLPDRAADSPCEEGAGMRDPSTVSSASGVHARWKALTLSYVILMTMTRPLHDKNPAPPLRLADQTAVADACGGGGPA